MTALPRRSPPWVTAASFAAALLLFVLAGVVTWRNQVRFRDSAAAEAHTYVVLETAVALHNRILEGESNARAYTLTGAPDFRRQAEAGIRAAGPLVDSLRTLTLDNPAQQARLDTLAPIVAQRIALVRARIAARDSAGRAAMRQAATVTRGDAVMRRLRAGIGRLQREELRLLDARTGERDQAGRHALWTAMGAMTLGLLVLGWAAAVTLTELRDRVRAEARLQAEARRQASIIRLQQAIATAPVGDGAVMRRIAEELLELTSADGASVGTVVDGALQIHAASGILARDAGLRVPLADALTGWVVREQQAAFVDDVQTDPRTARSPARTTEARGLAALPLTAGERVAGVLVLATRRPGGLGADDLQVLQICTGIISAGFSNAAAFAENQRLLAELRESRDAAEQANLAKSAFLATMSHELRTPLNSVIGFANLLLRNRAGTFGPQDLQFLERIRDNGTHLLALINDILDLSKIEAGKVEVRPVPTDLADLLRATAAQLEGQVRASAVPLRLELPEGLAPATVDPARFRQVIINLVGNALKFTERGEVVLRVVAGPAGRPLRVEVQDTGIGIPADRLEAIFDAFTQAETSTERRYGGTGLGLAISRQLLRLMGADLSVTSAPGAGSTFAIVFPAAAAVARAAVAAPRPAPAPDAPLVLVVDDEADARVLLTSWLQEDGYRTLDAADGPTALALAEAERPALILLDVRMPEMSGLEFLAHLRRRPGQEETPVLLVTVDPAQETGGLLGPLEVIPKPVDRDALLRAVQRALPSGTRHVLVVDDDVQTRQLYSALLTDAGYRVRTATDGLAALRAIEEDHPDVVLLDLMMPVMDGAAFLATLRREPRWAALPVAIVTALDAEDAAVRNLEGVAQAVLQKGPALERTLQELVGRLLRPPATP